MTPARAALQLHAVLAALEEIGIPFLGARILADGRWYIKVGPCEVVDIWRAWPESRPYPLTTDRHGVRIWSRP